MADGHLLAIIEAQMNESGLSSFSWCLPMVSMGADELTTTQTAPRAALDLEPTDCKIPLNVPPAAVT